MATREPGYIFHAQKFKQLRLQKMTTQEELANRVGTSVAQISRVETGANTPRFSTIKKLAKALEIDPYELVTFKTS